MNKRVSLFAKLPLFLIFLIHWGEYMKRHLVYLSFILLSVGFSANTLLAVETPIMLCSGLHENGSRANVEITKIWHHLEPGMEPETTYEISYIYIGENSLGFWNHTGSVVKGNISLSNQEVMNARRAGELSYINEQSDRSYYINFSVNLNTKDGVLSHRSGMPVNFVISLRCTGDFE